MATPSCRDCLTGTVTTAMPTGSVTNIHSLPTYVARPKGTPNGLVVMIPDLFGWELPNARVWADTFAERAGVLVYLPEFMDGKAASEASMKATDAFLTPSKSIFTTLFYKPIWFLRVAIAAIPFLTRNKESIVKPRIWSFHKSLRADPETKDMKIGSAGFCWGGKYTILLCQDDEADRVETASPEGSKPLIDAGFTAHPSKMKFPDDYQKVAIPMSVAIGDRDHSMKVEMVKDVKEILEGEKTNTTENQLIIYPGAKHGFAYRANPNDSDQVECAGKAMNQALRWFSKWFDFPIRDHTASDE